MEGSTICCACVGETRAHFQCRVFFSPRVCHVQRRRVGKEQTRPVLFRVARRVLLFVVRVLARREPVSNAVSSSPRACATCSGAAVGWARSTPFCVARRFSTICCALCVRWRVGETRARFQCRVFFSPRVCATRSGAAVGWGRSKPDPDRSGSVPSTIIIICACVGETQCRVSSSPYACAQPAAPFSRPRPPGTASATSAAIAKK